MIYCDKCKNHLAQRNVRGCNTTDHSFGPFTIDLCPRCYNEFRATVAVWLNNNNIWEEADVQAHLNENMTVIDSGH